MLTRCTNCIIATDDFNRADGDSLGANWSEVSGDADISGDRLLWVTAGIAIHQTAHPGGASAPSRVKVRCKHGVSTDYFRAILGWQDASNYLYVSVEPHATEGCIVLRLFKVVAGTPTELQQQQFVGDEWFTADFATLEACLVPADTSSSPTVDGVFRAKFTLEGGKVYGTQYTGSDLAGGTKVGLAGGNQGEQMDDFRFDWMGGPDQQEHVACPDCNTPCLVESDNFNRGDTTSLGCKWNEVSGVWQIVSNELKMISGGPGAALCRVFHPQAKTHHHVTADLYVDTGLKPRVIVNSKGDASSYHWAELEWTDATDTLTIRIGKDGTTLATETSTLGAAGLVGIAVCYDGSVLTATANGETVFDTSTAVADGIYVGLSGNSTGGERFDNFIFQKHRSFTDPKDPNCPFCEELFTCHAVCIDDLMNANYLAEFDPPAAGTCIDPSVCANIPTTHAVRFVEEGIGCKTHNGVEYCGRECHFIGSLFDSCGGISDAFLAVEFWLTDGGDRLIIANMGGSGSAKAVWILELPGEIDCLALSNLELPLVASWDASDPCDWSVVGPLRLSVT